MKKLFSKILIAAIAVFVIYNLISLCNEPEKTMVAQLQTIEITYNFDGVVSRNERIVSTAMSGSGWFEPAVSEGEMVKRGKNVGVYYDGEFDSETKVKLNAINAAIEEMSMSSEELNLLGGNETKIEQSISEKKKEILNTVYSRDMSDVEILKKELMILLDKRGNFDSQDGSEPKTLNDLIREKESIENTRNIRHEEISAPCHGVFTTHIDEFETKLTPKLAMSMTVDDFETLKLKEDEEKNSGPYVHVCKIIDNSQWWISMLAKESDVKDFKIGENVKIRISGESRGIDATVKYISPAKGDKYILTLSSNFGSSYIMENRFMNVTIIKESYSGLEIPISAIRVKDGKTGVYVKADSTTKFRETEIIYKNDKIAIVKVDSSFVGTNSLLLYDEVYIN